VFGTGPILEHMTSLTGELMYFGTTIKFQPVLLDLLLFGTNLILVSQGQIPYFQLLPRQKGAALLTMH
jgi:hypothetical protein